MVEGERNTWRKAEGLSHNCVSAELWSSLWIQVSSLTARLLHWHTRPAVSSMRMYQLLARMNPNLAPQPFWGTKTLCCSTKLQVAYLPMSVALGETRMLALVPVVGSAETFLLGLAFT